MTLGDGPSRRNVGDGPSRWDDALAAIALFAVDPAGLGGICLRSAPDPLRDRWLAALTDALPADVALRRLPIGIADDRLLGGVDLVMTLATGRTMMQQGLLAEADGGIVLVPMAERIGAGLAARLAAVLDRHEIVIEREGIAAVTAARIGMVALDEGQGDDERLPAMLADRLAFQVDLEGIGRLAPAVDAPSTASVAGARQRLAAVAPAAEAITEALVGTAAALGIASVVPVLLAVRAARAAAALAGRAEIGREDAVLAARLVLAPRALMRPAQPEAEAAPESPDSAPRPDERPNDPVPGEAETDAAAAPSRGLPPEPGLEEVMRAAVETALPQGLLEASGIGAGDRRPAGPKAGAGAVRAAPRGRPAGTRIGALRPGVRLALVETLRAAAPWQSLRRSEAVAPGGRVLVRPQDFRLKRYVQQRESTIVFAVDASGSTAFQRLAEAKGAVELLLAEAYVARTYVALVAFRGVGSELLLPPTRSLSRAKALLQTLPGGGGTPLAAGLETAVLTALAERSKGRQPLLVVLTDGRANVGRDGLGGRARAADEALDVARQIGAQGLASVFVDTAPRPRGEGAELARAMGARYVALPLVEAGAVRDVVRAAAPVTGGLTRAS